MNQNIISDNDIWFQRSTVTRENDILSQPMSVYLVHDTTTTRVVVDEMTPITNYQWIARFGVGRYAIGCVQVRHHAHAASV